MFSCIHGTCLCIEQGTQPETWPRSCSILSCLGPKQPEATSHAFCRLCLHCLPWHAEDSKAQRLAQQQELAAKEAAAAAEVARKEAELQAVQQEAASKVADAEAQLNELAEEVCEVCLCGRAGAEVHGRLGSQRCRCCYEASPFTAAHGQQ